MSRPYKSELEATITRLTLERNELKASLETAKKQNADHYRKRMEAEATADNYRIAFNVLLAACKETTND